MALFNRKKSTQGCIVIIGTAVDSLSEAFLARAKAQDLVIYQVNHFERDTTPHFYGMQHVISITANLTHPKAMVQVFKKIKKVGHVLELVIFQPVKPVAVATSELKSEYMQQRWQDTGLSAINIAQHAIKQMLPRQQGTFIGLGSVHATAPDAGWLADGAMQAGLRALLQSLAREFQPQGIHVSYIGLNDWSTQNSETAQAIAQTCWHIYQQPDSAWSQELTG